MPPSYKMEHSIDTRPESQSLKEKRETFSCVAMTVSVQFQLGPFGACHSLFSIPVDSLSLFYRLCQLKDSSEM